MVSVTLNWPDGSEDAVPALWLRDNCPCSDCRVEATSEHRFIVSDVPEDLAPTAVTADASGVLINWGDHESHYTLEWMDDVRRQITRDFPPPEPWLDDAAIHKVSYPDLVQDQELELAFLDHFCRFGAAVLFDTPTEPGWSETLYRRWGPPTELPFARIHDVMVDPAGYNVAHTAEALPPHNDFASKRHRPSGQVLHMLVNEASDGDSIVVDGLSVLNQLSPADINVLAAVPVSFRQFSDSTETWSRATVVQRDESGNPSGLRFSNQLLQASNPWDSRIEDWYHAYRRLAALVLDRSNQVHFRLNSGDLLMLHGHRMLHGRAAFSPASGRRHLQDIYFDFDDVANELYRLQMTQSAL